MVLEQLEGAWAWLHWVSRHLLGIWEPCPDLSRHLAAFLLSSCSLLIPPTLFLAALVLSPYPTAPCMEPLGCCLSSCIDSSHLLSPSPQLWGLGGDWITLLPAPRVEEGLEKGIAQLCGSRGDTSLSHPLASQSPVPDVRGWRREIPLQAGSPWSPRKPGMLGGI